MATPSEDLGTGQVTIEIDDAATLADLNRLQDRIERALDEAAADGVARMQRRIARAFRTPVTIAFDADMSAVDRAIDRVASTRIVLDVDASTGNGGSGGSGGDGGNGGNGSDGDNDGGGNGDSTDVDVDVDVDTERRVNRLSDAISGLGGVLTRVGGVAASFVSGIASMGTTMVVGASVATSFAAALAPAAGILAAGPAVILGYNAALGTLEIALHGVEDAFDAALNGSAEEFEEAIAVLSPAAQEAAREIRALKPEIEGLQDAVQESFFDQFAGQITETARALGGPLEQGLTGIAEEFGNIVSGALEFLATEDAIADITSVLEGTREVVRGIGEFLGPVATGFLDVAAAVAEAFGEEAGDRIGDIGERIGAFLTGAAESGEAVEWVRDAIDLFQQLGEILAGVFEALAGADAEGGDSILDGIQAFVESGRMAELIAQFDELGDSLIPLIGDAAELIGYLSPLVSGLVDMLAGLGGGFSWIGDKISQFLDWLDGAGEGFADWIEDTRNDVVIWFENMWSNVRNWATRTASDAISQFTRMATGIGTQAARGVADVINWIRSLPGRIAGFIGSVAASSASIGRGIISGMVSGILGGASAVMSAVGRVAAQAVAKARSVLGIHSPSTVFADIGEDTDRGLIVGMDRMAGAVVRTAESLARSVVRPFESTRPAIGGVGLTALSEPVLEPFNGSRSTGATPAVTSRQTAAQTSGALTFNVYGSGDPEVAARKVLNRLTLVDALM